MSRFTRRTFLQRASLGVAAAGGAIAFLRPEGAAARVDGAGGRPSPLSTNQGVTPTTPAEPFLVYVRDPAAGEISLFIGTREIRVRDAEVVRRLAQARI